LLLAEFIVLLQALPPHARVVVQNRWIDTPPQEVRVLQAYEYFSELSELKDLIARKWHAGALIEVDKHDPPMFPGLGPDDVIVIF
jgi:hypothetical protein